MHIVAILGALVALATLAPHPAPAGTAVDLELILAADISGSMDRSLGRVQRQGYAQALRAPDIQAAIASGPYGRIALAYIEWGDAGLIDVVVPWTLVAGPTDADAIAQVLETRRIGQFTKTSISHALQFASAMFDDNGFDGARQVVDISGNGPNNQGAAVTAARDQAVARGVVINGLPILGDLRMPRGVFDTGFDRRQLDRYFADCVIGGAGAFVLMATDASDFARAVRRKLALEISGRSVEPPLVRRVAAQPPMAC